MATPVHKLAGILGIVAFLLPPAGRAVEAIPQRIVSINLCADELLVALADPGQIASLSVYATDPDLSTVVDRAEAFPHRAASAESVVALAPDLVLAGRFTKRDTRDMLARLGYRLELLDAPRSIAASEKQIRQVATLLGHPERGEALVAEIEAAKARTIAAALPGHPTAANYQRRGYVAGSDTLMTELLAVGGFADAGGALAGKTGGFVPLEEVVAHPPDYIVVASAAVTPQDEGSALLAHPALIRLYPADRRIVLPPKLTVCGGPSLPAALDRVAAEAARVRALAP
jgi:iron complex transport system substrate-binding protein